MRNDTAKFPPHRNRFGRRNNVITERRPFAATFGTDFYRQGDPIFAERRSSPARLQFRAARRARLTP